MFFFTLQFCLPFTFTILSLTLCVALPQFVVDGHSIRSRRRLTCRLDPLCFQANCVEAFGSITGKAFYRFHTSCLHFYGLPVDTCTSTLFDKLHVSVTHLPCPASNNEYACWGREGWGGSYQSVHSRDSTTFFFLYILFLVCLLQVMPKKRSSSLCKITISIVYLLFASMIFISWPFHPSILPSVAHFTRSLFFNTGVREKRTGRRRRRRGREEDGRQSTCLSFFLSVCLSNFCLVRKKSPFKSQVAVLCNSVKIFRKK